MAMTNEETDIEALQAQIDLSNSVAFDIVSSWMKPSTSNSKQPVPLRTTRDPEELTHRPPRLGLGAKVSKSTIATAQEAAKLKGKLSKKQPIRDNEIADDSKKRKNVDEDEEEEEEESRNTVINQRKATAGSSKRVIDVFSFNNNKKRKRSNSHSEVLKPTGTVNNDPSITTLLAPAAHISPPSKKRKDKGKNKQEDNALSNTNLFDEEWAGFSEEVLEGIYDGIVPDGPPSTPSPPPSSSKGHSPRRVSSLSPTSRPALFRGFSVDDQKISLLNLHGPPPPPPTIEEGDRSSTVGSDKKKKRRRKRKKRKSDQAQGSGDT
ncbi:hypothetical protein Clacol_001276 [Clathrus columnatus]|uniref:Uncharacterized protein n=1 Tax=Clathrus columnatus TaxID=1419009 RepID=A0AAV5A0Y6_9AGAM|nr:hypothetical protein Clacol_001276 [Clathrus columnatus]